MTYEESSALMTDIPFRGRIKVAVTKFATYIFNEPAATAGHSSRYRWAQSSMQSPDIAAQSIQHMVVMDAQVQTDGAAISDENLQTAVEAVVGKIA